MLDTDENITPDELTSLGLKAHQSRRPDAAIDYFTEAIEKQEEDPAYGPFVCRARVYLEIGHFDSCIGDCEKAIGLNGKCISAYFQLGQALAGKRNFEEALKALEKAEELEPENGMVKTQMNMVKA